MKYIIFIISSLLLFNAFGQKELDSCYVFNCQDYDCQEISFSSCLKLMDGFSCQTSILCQSDSNFCDFCYKKLDSNFCIKIGQSIFEIYDNNGKLKSNQLENCGDKLLIVLEKEKEHMFDYDFIISFRYKPNSGGSPFPRYYISEKNGIVAIKSNGVLLISNVVK